jgi:hypothetical protein
MTPSKCVHGQGLIALDSDSPMAPSTFNGNVLGGLDREQTVPRSSFGRQDADRPARNRKGVLSPMNPSRRASNRIKNPLPIPKLCPHDSGPVKFVPNDVIYGRSTGDWPWALMCLSCKAYVGLHRFTGIPVGTLATQEIREARKQAKEAFDTLCKGGQMTLDQAYRWLAYAIGVPNPDDCRIGRLDASQCEAASAAVKDWLENGQPLQLYSD